mmetsp:Transcript_9318/g.16485  ORF Transcript_9318/g.16485 Transcript_9318/m.16485 type:complete len:256 (+) Transcript_9318:43-810(+)|eukprot:CAMPEP_0197627060 /NCGR_PEP_ID=MMETSP1338-20131121/5773_1 /TAXON_ID=43686 ORGANISM="Pelagodinium beii, Strain RCC1491" /NCGR_SAMPLE_ID=MMETSP1338 /ASSEMBLY_ACC=CAM_ASM_000754 /LENGTH=255 /DNA_ID=CAMNT_0043197675 /DNA_START=41 /DNA_END=808 /DNA_ORIENTATION=+
MGLPLHAAANEAMRRLPDTIHHADRSDVQNFVEAPLRLQAESYEDFARMLPSLSQEQETSASVEEELRRLQIDPEVFYRQQKRLEVSQFSADDLDPSATSASSAPDDSEEVPKDFSPPPRPAAKKMPAAPSLNIPSIEEVEDLPFEEITLAGEGETHGGRLGHATPEGLSARLQVDSLTDDGDEDDFRKEVLDRNDDGDDVVEAFSLDPDFDYDNTEGLTSKVTEPERSALQEHRALPQKQSDVRDEDLSEAEPC